MTTTVVSGVGVPVVILVMAWLVPAFAAPSLPFGVRIPAARQGEAVLAEQRRAYRRWLGVGGGVVVACGVAMAFRGWNPVLGLAPVAAAFGVGASGYVRARRAVLAAKESGGWYQGLRQGTAADTSLRTRPVRFPWPWAVPAVLIVAATTAIGVTRYGGMPPQLATHFGTDGTVDRFAPKSVASAFAPVFAQFGLTAVILLTVWLVLRGRADLDPAEPAASAARHRRFVVRTSAAILVLAGAADLTILLAALRIWHGDRTISPAQLLTPVLFGLAAVVVVAVRTGKAGSRPTAAEPPTGLVHVDDDRYWRLAGTVYANRQDPALLVPKRLGIGWTVNLGNPRSLLLVALIAGFVVAMSAISS
ncbi:DUF1648 domain-containing protein [Kitasatospora sp. McL0602]|uniref:DUF1648 domain-containing protein n=1 Tax=Kitasatospora sp. McL0602 TaxID=3439530 RepID=UPI003F8BEE3D